MPFHKLRPERHQWVLKLKGKRHQPRPNRGMDVQDPAEKSTPHQKDFPSTTNPSLIVHPNGFVDVLNPFVGSISHQRHFLAKHFLYSFPFHKNDSRSPLPVLTDKRRLLATAIVPTKTRSLIHLIARTTGIENGFLVEVLVCASTIPLLTLSHGRIPSLYARPANE